MIQSLSQWPSIEFEALFPSKEMGCSFSSIDAADDYSAMKNDRTNFTLTDVQMEQLLKTRFNRQEILDWHRSFIEKSRNREKSSRDTFGFIDQQLFIDYFRQMHPNGDVQRLTEIFFRIYDTNGDGKIDFVEFMTAVSVLRRGDLTEKLSLIFSLIDSNQQGFIDRFKLVKIMEALYQIKGINYKNGYNILLRKIDHLISKSEQEKDAGRIPRFKFIEICLNDENFREIINNYK